VSETKLLGSRPSAAENDGVDSPAPGWHYRLFERYGIKNVLDVGANRGGFVPTWLDSGAEHVLALEPVPDCYAELAARFLTEPRVSTRRLAASDASGYLRDVNVFHCWTLLPDGYDTKRSGSVGRSVDFVGSPAFDVELVTIDDLLARECFDPDFIKIDVDGYEAKVLRGAQKTLARRLVPLMLEISYMPERLLGDSCEAMVSDLFALGYQLVKMNGGKRYATASDLMAEFPWHTSWDAICEPVGYRP
jgi:FkbM family methyltransferase